MSMNWLQWLQLFAIIETLKLLSNQKQISSANILLGTTIQQIATRAIGVEDEWGPGELQRVSIKSTNGMIIDSSPFHKLCYSSFVTTKDIDDYLHQSTQKRKSAPQIDPIYGMIALRSSGNNRCISPFEHGSRLMFGQSTEDYTRLCRRQQGRRILIDCSPFRFYCNKN